MADAPRKIIRVAKIDIVTAISSPRIQANPYSAVSIATTYWLECHRIINATAAIILNTWNCC